MTKEKLEQLLGRPLTPIEDANRELYLEIAKESLESMLCTSLNSENDTRIFETRDNYRTVFTGVFTDVQKVVVDGNELLETEYSVRQWDNRNGKWFNSIVLDEKYSNLEVAVTADWGFNDCMPKDLQLLYAQLFAKVSTKNTSTSNVQSKQVEDFRITYRTDSTLDEQFADDNAATIVKYSLCGIGQVRSGEVYHDGIRYVR